ADECEFEIEDRVFCYASNDCRHSAFGVAIQAGLRAILFWTDDNRTGGRRWQLQLLGQTIEGCERPGNFFDGGLFTAFHSDGFQVAILDRNTVALGADLEWSGLDLSGGKIA